MNLIFVVIFIAGFPGFVFPNISIESVICLLQNTRTKAPVTCEPNAVVNLPIPEEEGVCNSPHLNKDLPKDFRNCKSINNTYGTCQRACEDGRTFEIHCRKMKASFSSQWFPIDVIPPCGGRTRTKSFATSSSTETATTVPFAFNETSRTNENSATQEGFGYIGWTTVGVIITLIITVIALISVLVYKYQKAKSSASMIVFKYEGNLEYTDVIPQNLDPREQPESNITPNYLEMLPPNVEHDEEHVYDYIDDIIHITSSV